MAGVLLFRTAKVDHAQYIAASPAGREVGALDALFLQLIERSRAEGRTFDLVLATYGRMRIIADLIGGIGAVVLVTGTNLLELALGTEMISLVGAALVALGQGQRPLEAGFKYLVLGTIGSIVLVYGAAFLYGQTGSFMYAEVGASLHKAGAGEWLAITGTALAACRCSSLARRPRQSRSPSGCTASCSGLRCTILNIQSLD